MNSAQIDKKGKKKNHRGPSSASAHKAHSSRSNLIGDLLYMYGFWVEYIFVCAYRKAHAVVKGIASTLGNLLMVVLRPVLLGIITFCEDLISPFTRMASGIRHIRELPQELSDAGSDQIRAAKKAYVRSGIRKYYTLLWNAITYVLPAIAAAVLVVVVRNGLGLRFVLNVQVNGESVGYVASEQIFENAREDVRSRINTAKSMLEEAGASVPDGTAVYIDGTLRFVTTEGDHLRTYLESIKAPFENDMDSSIRTGFVHDIRLLDGVYLQESIMSYSDVISALNEGSGVHTYVAEEGDTVQSVVDTTGVTFDSLAQMNPDLQSLDQEIPAGTELLTGASSAELLKVKVVQTETETVAIPFSTEKSESDEYDFGKTVTLQEGVDGLEDVTYEITMIDGEVTDRQAVSYNVLQEPVTQITVTGTKLKNGMVAKLGSGSFVWPVPGYKYVSRWMGNGHRGADICAAYGTPIYASDSGTVIAAGWHYSYGNYVEIDHGNGYKTLYAHMSRILVSQGQAVSKMDQIGEVGSTGNSTGNHCHFEMYYNNVLFSAQTLFGGM